MLRYRLIQITYGFYWLACNHKPSISYNHMTILGMLSTCGRTCGRSFLVQGAPNHATAACLACALASCKDLFVSTSRLCMDACQEQRESYATERANAAKDAIGAPLFFHASMQICDSWSGSSSHAHGAGVCWFLRQQCAAMHMSDFIHYRLQCGSILWGNSAQHCIIAVSSAHCWASGLAPNPPGCTP